MGKTLSKAAQRKQQDANIAEDAGRMRASFFADKEKEAVEKMKAAGASEEQINEVRGFIAQAAGMTDDGW